MIQSDIFNDQSWAFSGVDFFNYAQGRLIQHLVAGTSYCVTFYVVNEEGSRYAINKIGAYLDDGTIDTTHTPAKVQSQYTAQVFDTTVISDTLNWIKIQGSFIANGTEKFITIGMFFDSSNMRYVDLGTGGILSLYLIDDVSVIASDAVANAGRDTLIQPGDTAMLGPAVNGDGMPCYWYRLGVASPIDSGGNTFVHPTATTSYVVAMNLCERITYDTVTVRVWPDTVTAVSIAEVGRALQLYPNPATTQLTIEEARGLEVSVFDVVGSEVLHGVISSDKEVLDISRFARGIYLLQLSDGVTRERVVRRVVVE